MRTKRKAQIVLDWSIPLLLLVAATVWIRVTGLDLSLQAHFYENNVGWVGGVDNHWVLVNTYGVSPSLAVAIASLLLFVASFWVARIASWRYITLFLVIVMVIGPGLIVNATFKRHWGRPRPLDLTEFNRDSEFVPVWGKPVPGSGSSFPSGHAATAFYLFTPYFLLRRRSWRWATFFLLLGLGYGALVGVARMAAGAHFLSDVVWSAGFVYLTGLALSYSLPIEEPAEVRQRSRQPGGETVEA